MKKKVLPVIVAILLILVIGGCALGKVLLDKYSYSKEEADWNEFYQVSENDRSACSSTISFCKIMALLSFSDT